jgi:hypothetical protein
MVMFILLGFIDVLIAALMITTHLGLLHEWRLAIMSAAYLIGKGIIFRGDFLSVLDMLAAVYFILIMLGVRTILVYAFALLLAYKFITSLIMSG